jgi:hypothetical protein
LTASDAGRTVNVGVGGLVQVTLLGSATQTWQPIQLGGSALRALVNPAGAATRGTQVGEYCAASTGVSSLSSSDGQADWMVIVEVR